MSSRIYLRKRVEGYARGIFASGLAFFWGQDRGRGLNEIGRSFSCNKSSVHSPTWRTTSGEFVKVQYKINHETKEMRGRGLNMPHKVLVTNKIRRSDRSHGTLTPQLGIVFFTPGNYFTVP